MDCFPVHFHRTKCSPVTDRLYHSQYIYTLKQWPDQVHAWNFRNSSGRFTTKGFQNGTQCKKLTIFYSQVIRVVPLTEIQYNAGKNQNWPCFMFWIHPFFLSIIWVIMSQSYFPVRNRLMLGFVFSQIQYMLLKKNSALLKLL